jgi:hypothetical protein
VCTAPLAGTYYCCPAHRGRADGRAVRRVDRQAGMWVGVQVGRRAGGQVGRWAGGQAGRWAGWRADRQAAGRWATRQAETNILTGRQISKLKQED